MKRSTTILPDFLVIGAYKSGTTALHHHLSAHPQVFVPRRKEPNYFAFAFGGDGGHPAAAHAVTRWEDYLRLFEGAGPERAVGEVSPEYLANPRAPAAIKACLPDVRLLAVLRNPIERAYSDFLMYRRDGLEPEGDFQHALDEQEERRARRSPTGCYVATGFYGEQLSRYVDLFAADQLRVHLYDELVDDPSGLMGDVFAYLGVDNVPLGEPDSYNASGVPANPLAGAAYRVRRRLGPVAGTLVPRRVRPGVERLLQRGLRRDPLPEQARGRLAEVYADDVALLQSLIGRDLSHWLEV